MIELESAKLRLPYIRRIQIDKVTASDYDLNPFLLNWIPDQIELFWMNWKFISNDAIKVDLYLDALCKTLRTVTKEVYLWGILLDESTLEKVVKSASNSERLVLRWCKISCSSALDFSTPSKYNTKFMSFTNWGNSSRNSDFKTNPSLFENIVEAISKSGLKDSLQILDIPYCGLDKEKVKGLFITHGMSNVSIVEESPQPMNM